MLTYFWADFLWYLSRFAWYPNYYAILSNLILKCHFDPFSQYPKSCKSTILSWFLLFHQIVSLGQFSLYLNQFYIILIDFHHGVPTNLHGLSNNFMVSWPICTSSISWYPTNFPTNSVDFSGISASFYGIPTNFYVISVNCHGISTNVMIFIRSWCPDLFSWNLKQFSSYFLCSLNQFHGISTNFSSFSINFQCIPTNFLGWNLNGFTCHLNKFQEMSTNLMSSETTSIGISSSIDGILTSSKELWKLLHPVSELLRKPSQWLLDNNQSSRSCELLLALYESRIVPLSRWVRSLDDDILAHQLNVKGPSLRKLILSKNKYEIWHIFYIKLIWTGVIHTSSTV